MNVQCPTGILVEMHPGVWTGQKSEHKQLIISVELKMSVTYNQSLAGVKYQIDEIK